MAEPLLEVDRLSVTLDRGGPLVVDEASFSIRPGETLALVGESGCGKSVTAQSLMRIQSAPLRISGGAIRFLGKDILSLSIPQVREVRGRDIGMVFQDPLTSLNPTMTVGEQIVETIRLHEALSRKAAFEKAVSLLRRVKLPDPESKARVYPHQISGGQRQRAMIAMAIACQPRLLIADEPTTALDVTVQAQVLSLIAEIQQEAGMAVLLITHDLGVVAEVADRAVVMYAGRIVEESDVDRLFENPLHPYTERLLAATPRPGLWAKGRQGDLVEIPGRVPALTKRAHGCSFASRCHRVMAPCQTIAPPIIRKDTDRIVACHAEAESGTTV